MPESPTSEPPGLAAEERLRALYRAASPTEKLAVVARLNGTLAALKEAALRAAHPAWSAEERRAALRRWWWSSLA